MLKTKNNMDYEKKYKEALEIAKSFMNPNRLGATKEELVQIFPELKESEEERIRKELIFYFQEEIPQCSIQEHADKMKEFIAWFEKQGEKDKLIKELGEYKAKYTQEVLEKHINSIGNKDDERLRKTTISFLKDFADKGYENAVECIDWLKAQGLQNLANSAKTCKEEQKPAMIQWKGDNLKEVIDFTGKSPKFDEWFNTWSDFENYVHSHNDILKLFCEDGSHYEVPVGAWIVRTPDGYNVASQATYKQKAAEWSEEDDDYRRDVSAAVNNYFDDGYAHELCNWLKSLKERYTWKPGERQIQSIRDCALNKNIDADTRLVLDALYQDLLKLREE